MIKYAKESGIKEVSSLTHGGHINEEKFEEKPAYIEVGINLAQLIDDKNAQIVVNTV